MRIYFSYNSIPELKTVPKKERRKVLQRAATALAGAASGRSQFRLAIPWLVLVVTSGTYIGSYSSLASWWASAVVCWLFVAGSYVVVFQFQVRRLRPFVRHVLAEGTEEAIGI